MSVGSRLVPLSCSTCPLWKLCLWSELSSLSEARRGEPGGASPLSQEAFLFRGNKQNTFTQIAHIINQQMQQKQLQSAPVFSRSVPVLTGFSVFPLPLIFASVSFWRPVFGLVTITFPLSLFPSLLLLLSFFVLLLVFVGFAEAAWSVKRSF